MYTEAFLGCETDFRNQPSEVLEKLEQILVIIKTLRNNVFVLSWLLIFASFTGCKRTDEELFEKPAHRNIPIKVAIIYNLGGAQAVAREDFYLLKKDAIKIWQDGGLMNDPVLSDEKIKELKARGSDIEDKLFRFHFLLDRSRLLNKQPSKFGEAIKPYIVKTVTTDFEGKATFESVPEGTYYIHGVTETRSGYAVWSYKISTNASKTVLLDNKNAVYSW